MKSAAILLCFVFSSLCHVYAQTTKQPNIILIITDDQGFGDFGFTGNPHVKTPVLDQLAKESTHFTNFHVSPVCAPTRSSLMTGRYSLRTGVRDTYNGGSIMASSEITIAELLQNQGYKTGIFGKWHLGDSYPSRPIDQGFDESLIHLSGGMGQVGDITTYYQGDSSYYDPVLWHNGEQEAYEGYCSDIFTQEAVDFITENREDPFFCYLSFNAPHTPLQVPEKYYDLYKDVDPELGFDASKMPEMSERDKESARKVYGMVSNIDDNIGLLLKKLDALNISDHTIVIFMTDNGPQQARYVGGMRGRKGRVYNGGIKVPLLIRHPDFDNIGEVAAHSAHIDIFPTIAEVCNVNIEKSPNKLDGRSLLPLLLRPSSEWPERALFSYWTRRFPELYKNIALQKGDYKLVGQTSYDASISEFQLFNTANDPSEEFNIVSEELDIAVMLKRELDSIYHELINSENILNPPLIEIGSRKENPVILNRNDASGDRGIWAQEEIYGKWGVKIHEGIYDLKFKFIQPLQGRGALLLETNANVNRKEVVLDNVDVIEMKGVYLPSLEGDLVPTLFLDKKRILPFWVEVERVK